MLKTRIRTEAIATSLCMLAFATACGSDDGTDAGDDAVDAGAAEADGGSSDAPADIDAVAACLVDAGFEVTREADQDPALVLPDAYKDSVGLVENVALGSIGDARGIGSVDFFTDADSASQEFDDGAGMRSEDVQAAKVGSTNWDYIVTAGDDPGVQPAIEGCLG